MATILQHQCALSPPFRSGCSTWLIFRENLSNYLSSDIRADSTDGLDYLYLFLQYNLLGVGQRVCGVGQARAGALRATEVLIKSADVCMQLTIRSMPP